MSEDLSYPIGRFDKNFEFSAELKNDSSVKSLNFRVS